MKNKIIKKKMVKEEMPDKENRRKYKPEKKKKEKTHKDKSDKKDSSKGKFKQHVENEMEEYKEGKLHSGSKKGPIVTNPKQAIAISLNVARRKAKSEKGK